jgi:hypothetical protein
MSKFDTLQFSSRGEFEGLISYGKQAINQAVPIDHILDVIDKNLGRKKSLS